MATLPPDPNEELPENEDHLNEFSDNSNSIDELQSNDNKDVRDEAVQSNLDINPQNDEVIGGDANADLTPVEELGANEALNSETYDTPAEEINDSEEFAVSPDEPIENKPVDLVQRPKFKRYLLEFEGRGNDYFFIAFRGYVLTVLTLGLYYPWARVQRMRYLLNNLWLDGSPFVFEATGKQVFRGFIKVYAVLAALGALYIYALIAQDFWLQSLMPAIFSLFGLVITPLAIHGSLRFRASKTSWKGIYFNYSGDLTELYNLFANNLVRLIVTLGIYNNWAKVKVYRYLIGNLRLGNIEFKYKGVGSEIFVRAIINVIVVYGSIAAIMILFAFALFIPNAGTFGNPDSEKIRFMGEWLLVPMFFLFGLAVTYGVLNFRVWIMRYTLRVTKFRLGKVVGKIDEKFNIANIALFETVNFLILVVTLGVGTPFVAIRRMQKYTQLISFLAPFDFDNVIQTGNEYNDAFGEDLGDQFDIQLDLM